MRATIELELDPVVELMVDATVNIGTDQAGIETGAAVGAFFVAVFIRTDNVSSHLGDARKSAFFISVIRSLFFLCRSHKAHKQGSRNQKQSFHITL